MSDIKEFAAIPDISYIDDMTLEQVRDGLLTTYVQTLAALTGEGGELPKAHPIRLALNSVALLGYQVMQYVDRAGKAGLLKYSHGDYLDNVALLKGLTRLPAERATVTVRFSIDSARTLATPIPAGTRVSNAAGVYFMTDSPATVAVGSTYADVACTALLAGAGANGLPIGTITTIVDPVPYISGVSNTTASTGGSDIESDEDLTRRCYRAPAGYGTAGSLEGYEYWAYQFRSDVSDVKVTSPSAGAVTVLFMFDAGLIPTADELTAMETWLSGDTRRPTTDTVSAEAPTEDSYNIALTYYISSALEPRAAEIRAAIADAVTEYQAWQRHLGRDINPSKLMQMVMAAGAKRVALTYPAHTVVAADHIAKLGTSTVTDGGLEDD